MDSQAKTALQQIPFEETQKLKAGKMLVVNMQDKINLHQQEQMTIEYLCEIKKSHIMARQANMHDKKLGQ